VGEISSIYFLELFSCLAGYVSAIGQGEQEAAVTWDKNYVADIVTFL
jgi:hypothetical protein